MPQELGLEQTRIGHPRTIGGSGNLSLNLSACQAPLFLDAGDLTSETPPAKIQTRLPASHFEKLFGCPHLHKI